MIFYKLCIDFGEDCSELEKDLIEDRISSYLPEFNRKNRGMIFCSRDPRNRKNESSTDYTFYIAYLAGKGDPIEYIKERFLKGCDISGMVRASIGETTTQLFVSEVSKYDRQTIKNMELYTYLPNGNSDLTEYLHNESKITKKKAIKLLSDNLCSSCCSEIERIFSHRRKRAADFNPVQYIISASSERSIKVIKDTLISSLYSTRRISSLRVTDMIPLTEEDWRQLHFSNIRRTQRDYRYEYKFQDGATVVICSIKTFRMDIELVASCINTNHEAVQTIVCVNKDNQNTINSLIRKCPGVRFVVLTDDEVSKGQAREFLKMLAWERGIRNCDGLFRLLMKKEDKYCVDELLSLYKNWEEQKCISSFFPEYEEITIGTLPADTRSDNAKNELDGLIGLEKEKQLIHSIISFYSVQKLRADRGLPAVNGCKHMVFAGNPGTAKTTVARCMTKMLKENGILERGNMIEVGRADLVGKHVGHTAPMVREAFEKARGSVLFIDEAYSLLEEEKNYGYEAINTIVQEMENCKDDLIVILAGYPEKMKQFVNANPGLKSRIAFNVSFEDYNTEELVTILKLFADNSGYEIDEDAWDKAKRIIEEAEDDKNFGNGRFVRKLFERAVLNQSSRIYSFANNLDSKEMSKLTAEDFTYEEDEKNSRHFGF